MLNVIHGHDQLIRMDAELATLTDVIPEGAAVKLDSSKKAVLTEADASAEDFVWWAFNSANAADEVNSAFKATGKITLLANSVFVAETDQFVAGTYAVGDKLVAENGQLLVGTIGDFAVARALGPVVDGVLTFVSLPLASKI